MRVLVGIQDSMIPGQSCNVTPHSTTWTETSPLGYFYGNRWRMTRCTGVSTVDEFRKCLKGRTLIIFGDSTTRQWYGSINDIMQGVQTSEKWLTSKWFKASTAVNREINFTVKWIPHSQPIYTVNSKLSKSIPTILSEIGSDENVIIVLHMYSHLLYYHYEVFWDRIRKIRQAVVELLERNAHVVIAIKGPHNFDKYNTIHDYMGFMFTDILRREFTELRERVIYLDQRDMTIDGCHGLHPDKYVVDQMVKTMFALVC
jgi:hypothetical protein